MRLQGIRSWTQGFDPENPPEPTSLRLSTDLNVLYGQNGAGKTTMLNQLLAGLTGIATSSPVEIHLDFTGRDSPELREWLMSAVAPYLVKPSPVGATDGDAIGRLSESPIFQRVLSSLTGEPEISLVDLVQETRSSSQEEDLLEALRAAHFILVAAADCDRNFEERLALLLRGTWEGRDRHSQGSEEVEVIASAMSMSRQVCLVPRGVESPRWEIWLTADLQGPLFMHATAGFVALAEEARRRIGEDDSEESVEGLFEHPLCAGILSIPFGLAGDQEDLDLVRIFDSWDISGCLPHQLADGLPVPIVRLATIDTLDSVRVLTEPEVEEVTRELKTQVASECGDEAALSEVSRRADALGDRADSLFRSLLLDAPKIGVITPQGSSEDPFSALEWFAMDRDGYDAIHSEPESAEPLSSVGHPGAESPSENLIQELVEQILLATRQMSGSASIRSLDELSSAEKRWALLSARLATSVPLSQEEPVDTTLNVLVLDEPEAHLHRTAELHAATGLQRLGRIAGLSVVVATHSPHLLDASQANLLRIHNGKAQPLSGPSLDALSDLGLMPSDLLSITRTVLLVEGRHDELIINHLLGDVLRRTNTFVLPLHGGKKLADSIESQVIFTFTQAQVIGLLDNLAADHVTWVWEESLVRAASQGDQSAISFIIKQMPGKKAENKFLRQWLVEAIRRGEHLSRLHPWGLERQDIIEYLPVDAFVRSNASWDDLRSRFQADRLASQTANQSKPFPDFKGWMTRTFGSDFSDESIESALARMRTVPNDFRGLGDLCERIGHAAP